MTQEEIETWNRSVTNKEVGLVIKDLPTKTSPGPENGTGEFYLTFTEIITHKLSENKGGSTFPKSFCKGAITQGHSHTKTSQENYRPITFMYTDAMTITTISAN